jgi:excisionase family DNA binding protein
MFDYSVGQDHNSRMLTETKPPSDFMSVQDVAEQFGVCAATIYRWVRSGVMPSIRYGNTIRVPRSAVYQSASEQDEGVEIK